MDYRNIDWQSKTVRNGIVGLVGLALAYWAQEVSLAVALSGAWAILQTIFLRDTIKESARAVVASTGQLLAGVHALAAATIVTAVDPDGELTVAAGAQDSPPSESP